mmetsp:Transcript_125159/g.267176  ORF Transcript_125159/g.267176 Transcript_125159/m.267176 type:complete len:218 (-) Transcript_125159:522-1175(-)
MDGTARHARAVKGLRELLAHALRAGEDQCLAGTPAVHESGLVHQIQNGAILVVTLDDPHELNHVLITFQLVPVPDHHLERLMQDLVGEPPHLPRPRCSEEERVAPSWYPLQDLPDLRLKAHVEHPVCLVQHQLGDPIELHLPALEEIVQPPRASHDAMDAPAILRHLVPLRRPAVHRHTTQTKDAPEAVGLVIRLLSELARGREHKEPRARTSPRRS